MHDTHFFLFIQTQDVFRAKPDTNPAAFAPASIDVMLFQFSFCHPKSFPRLAMHTCESLRCTAKQLQDLAKNYSIAGCQVRRPDNDTTTLGVSGKDRSREVSGPVKDKG